VTARKFTIGAFIAALLLGAVVAFAPLASTGSSSAVMDAGGKIVRTTTGPTSVSLFSSEGLWVLVVVAVPIAITLLPVLMPRRGVRIAAAALLWIGCLLGLLSVGLFFLPSAVLMTAAAARSDRQPAPTPS
jgi:hypothetical protein